MMMTRKKMYSYLNTGKVREIKQTIDCNAFHEGIIK